MERMNFDIVMLDELIGWMRVTKREDQCATGVECFDLDQGVSSKAFGNTQV